jgi:putative transposase
LPKAEDTNQIWKYDFVFDQSLSGRGLKMLMLIDEYTREYIAVSITSEKVHALLQRVSLEKGFPKLLRSDNGAEFIGQAVNLWLVENEIKSVLIEPEKP